MRGFLVKLQLGGIYILKFYTYTQLKDKLNADNNIDTINDELTIHSFKTYGYFNLVNNYKNEIKIVQQTKHINMYDLLAIREIDNDLQSLIFKYLIQVETNLKSHLSYLMADKFGVNKADYTNPVNYATHISARKQFSRIEAKKHIDFTKNPAKHFLDKYQDIPPWVYLKHIPLGDTKNIFNELKKSHKESIVDEILPTLSKRTTNYKIQCFKEHLDLIHDFRNSIAHGGRLLNYISVKKVQPKHYTDIFSKRVIPSNDIHKYEKRLYQLLLSIILLINESYLRDKFIAEVESLFQFFIQSKGNNFTDIFIEVSGLPNDFIFKLHEATKDINKNS